MPPAELQRDYRSNVSLEQGLEEKQTKIDSLQAEAKRARQQVLEKDRIISFFGRDLHRLVVHTEANQWREEVKKLYRTYVKKTADELEQSKEDEQVQGEFSQQRQYVT